MVYIGSISLSFFCSLWPTAIDEEWTRRRRQGIEVWRMAVAGARAGIDLARPVHQEQVWWCADHERIRHHRRSLSARVSRVGVSPETAVNAGDVEERAIPACVGCTLKKGRKNDYLTFISLFLPIKQLPCLARSSVWRVRHLE